MHEILVNRLGGLSLPRKSKVRLTDRPDMTLDVYRGRKTTMQQCNDLFYITVKYHDYFPKGIQVTERTRICIKKHQRGANSESMKARALIFVRDTSS